jgi:hypothetical protein
MGIWGPKRGPKRTLIWPNRAISRNTLFGPLFGHFLTPKSADFVHEKVLILGVKKMTFFGPFLTLKQVFSAQERFLAKK